MKEKFVPEAMAFTIVADIDEKRMEAGLLKLVGKFFADFRPSGNGLVRPARVELCNVFDEMISRKTHEANAVVGGYAPSLYEEKERLATVLLSNILAGPAMNSILNSILREKHGWVYGVESSYTQYADTGILAISLGCEKENLDRCLAAIDKEILKLQTQELTERKLNAAKKQLLGQLAISSDNGEAQCLSMGKSLLAYDKVWTGAETRSQIEGITSGQIMEMACRIFAPGKTSRLTMI